MHFLEGIPDLGKFLCFRYSSRIKPILNSTLLTLKRSNIKFQRSWESGLLFRIILK